MLLMLLRTPERSSKASPISQLARLPSSARHVLKTVEPLPVSSRTERPPPQNQLNSGMVQGGAGAVLELSFAI